MMLSMWVVGAAQRYGNIASNGGSPSGKQRPPSDSLSSWLRNAYAQRSFHPKSDIELLEQQQGPYTVRQLLAILNEQAEYKGERNSSTVAIHLHGGQVTIQETAYRGRENRSLLSALLMLARKGWVQSLPMSRWSSNVILGTRRPFMGQGYVSDGYRYVLTEKGREALARKVDEVA